MAAAKTEVIRDVPEDQKVRLDKDYKDLGATVVWSQQADGKWTLTATFPATSGGTGS
jgi:hypothetical protein